METFSALLAICAGNSPVPGEFPTQRPVTRSFDVFFDLRLNKPLSKQSWGWWFETLSCSLWRHLNVLVQHWPNIALWVVTESVDECPPPKSHHQSTWFLDHWTRAAAAQRSGFICVLESHRETSSHHGSTVGARIFTYKGSPGLPQKGHSFQVRLGALTGHCDVTGGVYFCHLSA